MVKKLGLHKADNGAIYRISINPATGKKMCRIVKGATKAGMKRIAKKTTKKGGSLRGLMKKAVRKVPRGVKRAGVNLAVGAINSQAKRYFPKKYHKYVDKGTKLARSSIAKKTGYGLHRNLTKDEQLLADQALEIAKQKMYHGSGFRMTIPR